MENILLAKQRREHIRWLVLRHLNRERPAALSDTDLVTFIRAEYPDVTMVQLHKELDYLRLRGLLLITETFPHWHLRLTYQGVDMVEYNTAEVTGIGRPAVALYAEETT